MKMDPKNTEAKLEDENSEKTPETISDNSNVHNCEYDDWHSDSPIL